MGQYDVGIWAFLRQSFAINGIIQGFTWLALALICVGLHYVVPQCIADFKSVTISQYTSFVDLISFCLYDTLLDSESVNNDHILMPLNFHIIAWIYAFLSACWFGLSIYECSASFKRKSGNYTAHTLMAIGLVTLATCVLDLTLFSIAMVDYWNINPFDYSLNDKENYEFQADMDLQLRNKIGRKISFGILATLAARGFVLWLLNCVGGSFCVFVSMKIFQTAPLLKYDDTIPRPKLRFRKYLVPESTRSSLEAPYSEDEVFSTTSAIDNRSWHYQHPPSRIYGANNEIIPRINISKR